MLQPLCMPALIYLIYSLTHVIIDMYKEQYSKAMIEFWISAIFTLLLNVLCQQGLGIVSGYIKRYLRIKFENKCCLCGWSKVNTKIGYPPLVADHIDGNWRNNVESNLRLICPNCDSYKKQDTRNKE